MNYRQYRRYWITLLVLAICGLASRLAVAQQSVTIEMVSDAWQKRQERFEIVNVSWRLDRHQTKGWITRDAPPEILRQLVPKEKAVNITGELPPQDHSHTTTESLVLAGDKYRYERQGGFIWSVLDNRFISWDNVVVYDGTTRKQKTKDDGRSFSQGWASTRKRPPEADLLELYPLTMAFRPMHAQLRAFDIHEFAFTGTSAVISGRKCLELVKRLPSEKLVISLWLDPERDYLLARFRSQKDAILTANVDVAYVHDARYGWLPDSWKVASYHRTGIVSRSAESKVTGYELNHQVSSGSFDIAFEPRTRVIDRASKVNYIVKADGSKRVIEGGELSATFEQLHSTESGEAFGKKPSRTWPKVVIIAAAVVLMASVLMLVYRWRNRGRSSSATA